MSRETNTIEFLVAGGLIGVALGAILSKDKEDGAMIGALLGTVFSATYQANQDARKTNVPVYVEENGKLYAIEPSGKKLFIKNIQKPTLKLSDHFKLK